jgi:hypothetical protein
MKQDNLMLNSLLKATGAIALSAITMTVATATEPCQGFGECKALVEINATDGDIGFHFLMDADDLVSARVKSPSDQVIFKTEALRELREQFFTETFVESAEPLCFDPLTDEDPENDEEDFVTLEDFLARWTAGTYKFIGHTDAERVVGRSDLSFDLPAAPANVRFNANFGVLAWDPGDDLGACANSAELDALVTAETLAIHPRDVPVVRWEIVLEPDLEDGDPLKKLKFTVRVPGDIEVTKVDVPNRYLAALPDDTPMKGEVGAIAADDNATFTEIVDLCVNEVAGCDGGE